MEVINQVYYHTAVTPESQTFMEATGARVIDESGMNPRHKELLDFAPKVPIKGKDLGYLDYLDYLIEDYNSVGRPPSNYATIMEHLANISHRVNNRYFERIIEDVRRASYPNHPSRLKCIYLAEASNIEYWHKKALDQYQLDALPIYEVTASGNVHLADAEWLDIGMASDDDFVKAAKHYWGGDLRYANQQDMREVLFVGRFEVVRKYESLQVYQQATLK
jgi:hypothetical protein